MHDDDDNDDVAQKGLPVGATVVTVEDPKQLETLLRQLGMSLSQPQSLSKPTDLRAQLLQAMCVELEAAHAHFARVTAIAGYAHSNNAMEGLEAMELVEQVRAHVAALLRIKAALTLKLADAHAPEV